jgi:superfamily I DNA/RNA helicase
MFPLSPDDARKAATKRAAAVLSIPEAQVEDDLIEFLVTDGDALLRARAGSGKTTALTIKAAFLVRDVGVSPEQIMMLTFNNAAARSLETRLSQAGIDGVRVRTFHALGQRIVKAHFGPARRAVFDEKSEDGQAVAQLMQDALDEVVNEKFYWWAASRMRTRYDKRKDYVTSVARDALLSAANFLRARGYGMQKKFENAWDEGPIVANAMKTALGFEISMKEAGLLDGPSVLQAASWTLERELEKGTMRPSDAHDVNWVFIDEFQDVSFPYMRLVNAMRELNGGLNIQGVGDDFQAINGFAGADLDHFSNAAAHLEDPTLLNLLKNRRSGSDIVAWGNAVMAEAGHTDAPAVPDPANGAGEVRTAKVSADRDLRFIAQRLADRVDAEAGSVALIARKWKVGDHKLPQICKLVREALKDQGRTPALTAITAHGAKGLEYDQVLLLDDGSFPIQHPSRPILEALIPEAEFLREEACLKHVAGTRARKILDVISM